MIDIFVILERIGNGIRRTISISKTIKIIASRKKSYREWDSCVMIRVKPAFEW